MANIRSFKELRVWQNASVYEVINLKEQEAILKKEFQLRIEQSFSERGDGEK